MNTLDLGTLASNLARAGAPTSVLSGALPAVRLLAVSGVREHFQRQESPDGRPWKPHAHARPGSAGGSQILRDKGRLLASIMARAVGHAVVLGASHPAAAVHQFGATIRPRLAKMLALPLSAEAARVGSPRQNRFPRPLFPYHPKNAAAGGRNLFLAERPAAGGKGRLVLHYLLRREVTVPARPYLGFSRSTLAKIERLLAARLVDWVARAFAPGSAPSIESYGVTL